MMHGEFDQLEEDVYWDVVNMVRREKREREEGVAATLTIDPETIAVLGDTCSRISIALRGMGELYSNAVMRAVEQLRNALGHIDITLNEPLEPRNRAERRGQKPKPYTETWRRR